MSTTPTFVIVGAGLAGAKAAETLRAEGFDGRLLLLGEDERSANARRCPRPTCAARQTATASICTREEFYADNDIELRPSTPVRSIHQPAS